MFIVLCLSIRFPLFCLFTMSSDFTVSLFYRLRFADNCTVFDNHGCLHGVVSDIYSFKKYGVNAGFLLYIPRNSQIRAQSLKLWNAIRRWKWLYVICTPYRGHHSYQRHSSDKFFHPDNGSDGIIRSDGSSRTRTRNLSVMSRMLCPIELNFLSEGIMTVQENCLHCCDSFPHSRNKGSDTVFH